MPFLEDHDWTEIDYEECSDCEGDGRLQDEDGQPTQHDCPTCGGTGDTTSDDS